MGFNSKRRTTKIFGFIVCILIASLSTFAFIGCEDQKAKRDKNEVIEDAVLAYGEVGFQDEDVKDYIDEIFYVAGDEGEVWQDIFDYWDYANNNLKVNMGILPDGLPDDDSKAIVVLGFELNADGTMQDELIGRLKVTLDSANKYPNAYVICTGGGTAKNNKDVTEAGLMGEWLVNNGLDESRLIIENKSMTTAQNAEFSYDIIMDKYPQIKYVAIVSSSYHIAWGSLLFESAFLRVAYANELDDSLHVISNAAYETSNDKYKDTLRFETGGMLQMIGDNDTAMKLYTGTKVEELE